jgi:hypothetical protein
MIEVTTTGGADVVAAGGVNREMEVESSSQGVEVASSGTAGVVTTTTEDAAGTDSDRMEEMIEETSEATGVEAAYPLSLEAEGLSGVADAVG